MLKNIFLIIAIACSAFIAFSCTNSTPSSGENSGDTATLTPTITGTPPTATSTVTATPTPTSTTVVVSVYGNTGEDGWLNNNGFTNTGSVIVSGDDSSNYCAQGLMSFTLPSLPSTVKNAYIRLKCDAISGDPFGTFGNLQVAHLSSDYTPLDASDFASPSGLVSIATVASATAGAWQDITVTNLVETDRQAAAVKSQFRFYFTSLTNNNNAADYVTFFHGGYMITADKSRLVIEY